MTTCPMARLPDLEALAVFARVADAGSFARAADELGLSTGTVSKAVSRLEKRLGAALLNRTSRRVSLTPLGHEMALKALRLVGDAEQMEADALAEAAAPRGLVRLAVPMSFGLQQVAPLLPDLMRQFPDITIDMHLSDERVDLVADGFDLALRIARLENSSLRQRTICEVRMLVVAAAGYGAIHGLPAHPRDLARHPCFGYAYTPNANRWLFSDAAGEQVSVALTGPLRVNNGEAVMPALRAGLGIAALPDFVVWEALQRGELITLVPGWSLPAASLSLLMPPGTLRPARVRATTDFLYRRLSRAPWARPRDGGDPGPSPSPGAIDG